MKRTDNPNISKYLNVNGKYSNFLSEKRKIEINMHKEIVNQQRLFVRTQIKNGEQFIHINKIIL